MHRIKQLTNLRIAKMYFYDKIKLFLRLQNAILSISHDHLSEKIYLIPSTQGWGQDLLGSLRNQGQFVHEKWPKL